MKIGYTHRMFRTLLTVLFLTVLSTPVFAGMREVDGKGLECKGPHPLRIRYIEFINGEVHNFTFMVDKLNYPILVETYNIDPNTGFSHESYGKYKIDSHIISWKLSSLYYEVLDREKLTLRDIGKGTHVCKVITQTQLKSGMERTGPVAT